MIADPELTEYLKQLQGAEEESKESQAKSAMFKAMDAGEAMDTSESARVRLKLISRVWSYLFS